MSGAAQKVPFARRESLPFAGLLFRFGTLVTGDRTWGLEVPGMDGPHRLPSGFWDLRTAEEFEEIARAMRFALDRERDHGDNQS